MPTKKAAKKTSPKTNGKSTRAPRTAIKKFEASDADKFVAKIQKEREFKSAKEATVYLIGYAANRMAALERHRKSQAA